MARALIGSTVFKGRGNGVCIGCGGQVQAGQTILWERSKGIFHASPKDCEREAIIKSCGFELSTNFDCPSEQILGVYGAKIGINSREMFGLLANRIA